MATTSAGNAARSWIDLRAGREQCQIFERENDFLEDRRFDRSMSCLARQKMASNMVSVKRPVNVFCWLG